MSNRGRGRGNGSAYRSYEDYDDSYASPGPRSGRSGGGGRGYRGIGGDSSYFLQYGNAGPHGGPHGGLHGGPHGGPYGGPPGRGPPRAPYTAPQYQLVYVEQQQQQQQLQQPPQPHPHYRAYPYQYRQQQQQHSSGRNSYEGNRSYSAGGGAISGRSRPQFTPPPVVAAAAASAAASVGGGAIMPVGDRTPRPATLPRAPLTTSAGSGTGSVTPRQSTAAAAAAAAIDPDAPNNTSFMTPVFPQPPRTRTDSCSAWALMVEASCQQLEAVVGPFLEGALMELFGESWERELFGLDLTLPPFSAAACAALVAKCKQLHEKLPITIHKRVEAVAQATESLKSSPGSLAPEDVTAAHTAMRGMLHDCIKAAKMPSLLGAGSRQWRAFCLELLPHAESALLYYDMLLADCTDAATARQHVRAASAAEEGGAAALPAPAAAATAAATP